MTDHIPHNCAVHLFVRTHAHTHKVVWLDFIRHIETSIQMVKLFIFQLKINLSYVEYWCQQPPPPPPQTRCNSHCVCFDSMAVIRICRLMTTMMMMAAVVTISNSTNEKWIGRVSTTLLVNDSECEWTAGIAKRVIKAKCTALHVLSVWLTAATVSLVTFAFCNLREQINRLPARSEWIDVIYAVAMISTAANHVIRFAIVIIRTWRSILFTFYSVSVSWFATYRVLLFYFGFFSPLFLSSQIELFARFIPFESLRFVRCHLMSIVSNEEKPKINCELCQLNSPVEYTQQIYNELCAETKFKCDLNRSQSRLNDTTFTTD